MDHIKYFAKLITAIAIILVIAIPYVPRTIATSTDIDLPILQDAFVSSSTQNGNRRMMFVGNYTDSTICIPEGCHPLYENSRALMMFEMTKIPPNAIPISGQLILSHYGSNADLPITISKITSTWNESVSFPGPSFEGNYGTKLIPSYNTENSSAIKEQIIQLSPTLLSALQDTNYGLLIRPSESPNAPGIVFCSHDSDAFCLPHHAPRLHVTYVFNNPPQTPQAQNPRHGALLSNNCDESNHDHIDRCTNTVQVSFTVSDIGDNDPLNGGLASTYIEILKDNHIIETSPPLTNYPMATWDYSLSDGVYEWQAYSVDQKGAKSFLSDKNTFTVDTTAPLSPELAPLAQSIDIITDSVTVQIQNIHVYSETEFQLVTSLDPTFTKFITSEWSTESSFPISMIELSKGVPYYFKVRAKDTAGNSSPWSNVVSTVIVDKADIPIPSIDLSQWGVLDGFQADGISPERSRLTSGYVIRAKSITLHGIVEKSYQVELFVNDIHVTTITPECQEVCTYSYIYTFPDQGEQDQNGIPAHSYAFQVRARSITGRNSPLSSKIIIFHDTHSPSIPTVNLSTSHQTSLVSTTNAREVTIDIHSERYSDIHYSLTDTQGKIIENRFLRIPFNQKIRFTSTLPNDGIYTFKIISADAAGNISQPWLYKLTRDTTPPHSPYVEPFLCDINICLMISGEHNSHITINQKDYGLITASPQSIKVIENWIFNQLYHFEAHLTDNSGNTSEKIKTAIRAPLPGIGDIKGASIDMPYAQFSDFQQTPVRLQIMMDGATGEYYFSETYVAAPVLTFHDRYSENDLDIYGLSLEKNHELDFKITIKYRSYNEAQAECKSQKSTSLRECMAQKMGFSSLDEWEKQINQQCTGWLLTQYSCIRSKKDEKKIIHKENQRARVPHIQINFFKEDMTHLASHWMSANSTFKVAIPMHNRLKTNDKIIATATIFGDLQFDGFVINYRYTSSKDTDNERGITSKPSFPLVINEAKLTFAQPVGFPLRNFKLDRAYPEYFGKVGSAEICKKISCNSKGKRGDFIISRGALINGHGAADIDLAPYAYNHSQPPLVVSTHDGILILDSDGYKDPPTVIVNGIKTRDITLGNNLEIQVLARDGTMTWYAHLNPLSYQLSTWTNPSYRVNIKRGDVIGFLGETGKATGPHLHYSIVNSTTSNFYQSLTNPQGLKILPEDLQHVKNKENVDNYIKDYLQNKNTISINF